MEKKKTRATCEKCKWGYINHCVKGGCEFCPRYTPGESFANLCKCLKVKLGDVCPDYEEYKEADNG